MNNQHTIESIIRRIKYAIVKKMAANHTYHITDILKRYKAVTYNSKATKRSREVNAGIKEFMSTLDWQGQVLPEVARSWFKNIKDPTDKVTRVLKIKHDEFGDNVYRVRVDAEEIKGITATYMRLFLLGVDEDDLDKHLRERTWRDIALEDCVYSYRTWEGEEGELEFVKAFILSFTTRNYTKIVSSIFRDNGLGPEEPNEDDEPLDDAFSFVTSNQYSPINDTRKTSKQIATLKRKLLRQSKENAIWRKLGATNQKAAQNYIAKYVEAYLTSETSIPQLLVSDNEVNQRAGNLMLKHEGKAFV